MIYRIGIYDLLQKKVISSYKFLKNPKDIKYSYKHIISSSDTIIGFLNFEWGLDQKKLAININMPFSKGYKDSVWAEAEFFEKQLQTVIDSRFERWFFGKKGQIYLGFVENFNWGKNADKPNEASFSINFLIDDYYKNYNSFVLDVNKKVFKLDEQPITIKKIADQVVSNLRDKLKV